MKSINRFLNFFYFSAKKVAFLEVVLIILTESSAVKT